MTRLSNYSVTHDLIAVIFVLINQLHGRPEKTFRAAFSRAPDAWCVLCRANLGAPGATSSASATQTASAIGSFTTFARRTLRFWSFRGIFVATACRCRKSMPRTWTGRLSRAGPRRHTLFDFLSRIGTERHFDRSCRGLSEGGGPSCRAFRSRPDAISTTRFAIRAPALIASPSHGT